MKITRVEAKVLRVPFGEDYWGRQAWKGDYSVRSRVGRHMDTSYPLRWRMRHRWSEEISTCLIRVETDEGLVGIGESKAPIAPEMIRTYVDEHLQHWALGEDPFEVRVLWDRYRAAMRGRGHIQGFHQEAAAGLDIACWDIIGKATGRPIAQVLGGIYHSRVPIYYSGLPGIQRADNHDANERLRLDTRAILQRGFTAAKIAVGFGEEADLASVRTVREVAGDDFVILVDALGSYDYTQALRLCYAFADAGVQWFETPLPPEDLAGYVELTRRSPIAIANDFLWTVATLKDVLASGVRMVVIPETIKVGITESLRIAELADTFGCGFAPHCSVGSAIQFAANLQVSAAAPNLMIGEYWGNQNRLTEQLLVEPLVIEDGHMVVPTSPGLGIELDDGVLNEVTG